MENAQREAGRGTAVVQIRTATQALLWRTSSNRMMRSQWSFLFSHCFIPFSTLGHLIKCLLTDSGLAVRENNRLSVIWVRTSLRSFLSASNQIFSHAPTHWVNKLLILKEFCGRIYVTSSLHRPPYIPFYILFFIDLNLSHRSNAKRLSIFQCIFVFPPNYHCVLCMICRHQKWIILSRVNQLHWRPSDYKALFLLIQIKYVLETYLENLRYVLLKLDYNA